MYLGTVRNQRRGRVGQFRHRGLGLTSTMVGPTLVYGETPAQAPKPKPTITRTTTTRVVTTPIIPVRAIGPARPAPLPPSRTVTTTTTTTSGSSTSTAANQNALNVALALYNSNPSLLTAQQWSLLQSAGIVASTLPYSSAGLVSTGQQAIDPNTGQTYASELSAAQAAAGVAGSTASTSDIGSTLSAVYGGLPLWLWLVIGGGGFYLFTNRGRR